MKKSYTVSQVNHYIANLFHTDFLLKRVNVSGEVSNVKYHSSGHIYFNLKDSGGVLKGLMFSSRKNLGLTFPMKDGDQVVVSGSICVYEKMGDYRILADTIQLDGVGLLYEKYLLLKNELEESGYFSPEYKRPIPKYVTKIGVVTAKTGAVIHDIYNVAKRRNPYIQILLAPCKVQGEGAAKTIVQGIQRLENTDCQVIIVGRGGGSIEDLWAFNERIVAEAIFNCEKPVISAVGHDTDFTIADFVSDQRAPTPSAAAELAVFEYEKFLDHLARTEEQLQGQMVSKINRAYQDVAFLEQRLKALSPLSRLSKQKERLKYLGESLKKAMDVKLATRKKELEISANHLHDLSPLKKIGKGFAYISDQGNQAIKTIKQVKEKDLVKVQLSDGQFDARILEVR